jgi:hypothetical protein
MKRTESYHSFLYGLICLYITKRVCNFIFAPGKVDPASDSFLEVANINLKKWEINWKRVFY